MCQVAAVKKLTQQPYTFPTNIRLVDLATTHRPASVTLALVPAPPMSSKPMATVPSVLRNAAEHVTTAAIPSVVKRACPHTC